MNKSLDLRISNTDKMIKEAFLDLLDTIGFEKISIINLTKKAKISRTTFYIHYKDKYDLLEQIENEILDGLKNIAADFSLDEIITNGLSDEKSYSMLLRVYEYIKDNQKFFKSIMCNNEDPYFYYKLSEAMKLTYSQNIHIYKLKIPDHYAIAFAIGVQTSIISEWIKSGMKETPQEIVSIVTQIMNNVPKNIHN